MVYEGRAVNIGIYIYDNAEVLDFSGPFEVFSTAKRLGATHLNVFLVAESNKLVAARGGYHIMPHHSFQTHPIIDVLVVVGGVHTDEMNKSQVIDWIRSVDHTAQRVVSVCTGAFLLAKAALLDDLSVTTHWEDMDDLARDFPTLTVLANKRWVASGKYMTSGGISAGIDMSLHLVAQLYNPTLAQQVAHQMEYRWL
jgi:transcriptional regulator GlxA family with amidase domain